MTEQGTVYPFNESFQMDVFHKLEDVPANFGPTMVSIGNFDGVHRAHSHVLGEIVSRARQQGAKAMAVTFEPHPVRILRPDSGLKLITPTPEKLRLLQASGLDAVLLLPFGRDLSLLTPRQFAEDILQKRLHAREYTRALTFISDTKRREMSICWLNWGESLDLRSRFIRR